MALFDHSGVTYSQNGQGNLSAESVYDVDKDVSRVWYGLAPIGWYATAKDIEFSVKTSCSAWSHGAFYVMNKKVAMSTTVTGTMGFVAWTDLTAALAAGNGMTLAGAAMDAANLSPKMTPTTIKWYEIMLIQGVVSSSDLGTKTLTAQTDKNTGAASNDMKFTVKGTACGGDEDEQVITYTYPAVYPLTPAIASKNNKDGALMFPSIREASTEGAAWWFFKSVKTGASTTGQYLFYPNKGQQLATGDKFFQVMKVPMPRSNSVATIGVSVSCKDGQKKIKKPILLQV